MTSKPQPNDVDAIIFLPPEFDLLVDELDAAAEMETMLLTRSPPEIFAAEDESDWEEWVEFFSRTREPNGRRKGLVEVRL